MRQARNGPSSALCASNLNNEIYPTGTNTFRAACDPHETTCLHMGSATGHGHVGGLHDGFAVRGLLQPREYRHCRC